MRTSRSYVKSLRCLSFHKGDTDSPAQADSPGAASMIPRQKMMAKTALALLVVKSRTKHKMITKNALTFLVVTSRNQIQNRNQYRSQNQKSYQFANTK